MRNKLYVRNLPYDPSAAALRTWFARAGQVTDVQVVPDNDGGNRAAAFVTMSTENEARRAVSELDGLALNGQALRVTLAYEKMGRDTGDQKDPKKTERDKLARITQQFREPKNMTYELDCGGKPLVVRVYFRLDDAPSRDWRIEARTGNAPDAASIAGTAASRLEAMRSVAQQCGETTGSHAFSEIDWNAVEQAMLTVHAL